MNVCALGHKPTFVRTVSLRMELGRVASFRRAPERTFPDKFLPVKLHCRRSRILSETAFACRAHTEPLHVVPSISLAYRCVSRKPQFWSSQTHGSSIAGGRVPMQ